MPLSISGSVGEGGVNRPGDVQSVFGLLNAITPQSLEPGDQCTPELIQAIRKFQRAFMSKPDGRIDANGRTWKCLLAAAEKEPAAEHSSFVPGEPPVLEAAKVWSLLNTVGITGGVAILGLRGFYLDSMGAPGRNDRGIYDDAIFVVSEHAFASFNANTDPSVSRKGVAVLKPGRWDYKVGTHGLSKPKSSRYTALVQAAKVTVVRDQTGDDTGWFGINIHKGGRTTTSSLGCQTIYPDQWPAFIELVRSELRRAEQKVVPYLLMEQPA